MYNLTVDTAHTFFVGEGQWLVHNACPIYGTVQKNVTKAHNDLLLQKAKELANSGKYDEVWIDSALSRATKGEIPVTKRPDVLGLNFKDRIAHLIEIPSPTQIYRNRKTGTVSFERMFLSTIEMRKNAFRSRGWNVISEIFVP